MHCARQRRLPFRDRLGPRLIGAYNGGVNRADAVIEEYKKSVDRTLLRENLRLTPEQRLRRLQKLQQFADELGKAGARLRRQKK